MQNPMHTILCHTLVFFKSDSSVANENTYRNPIELIFLIDYTPIMELALPISLRGSEMIPEKSISDRLFISYL